MIRNLAGCPYCGACEVALDENPLVTFNPGGDELPCPHLAWVEGRYSQWELSPQGINRAIGSTEFRWEPPGAGAAERTEALLPYLKELVHQGPGWAFAPPTPFALQMLSAEEKGTDQRGRSYTMWDVDGWAVFAENPTAFWAALTECQQRQLASLEMPNDKGT
ncbi:MAG: hypothetical protein HYS12_12335 [Planctomycetes bacterium]|nr:hypothetical protein [Planctomycetota bacterium]